MEISIAKFYFAHQLNSMQFKKKTISNCTQQKYCQADVAKKYKNS